MNLENGDKCKGGCGRVWTTIGDWYYGNYVRPGNKPGMDECHSRSDDQWCEECYRKEADRAEKAERRAERDAKEAEMERWRQRRDEAAREAARLAEVNRLRAEADPVNLGPDAAGAPAPSAVKVASASSASALPPAAAAAASAAAAAPSHKTSLRLRLTQEALDAQEVAVVSHDYCSECTSGFHEDR